jgi:hypothetical protein
MKMSTEKMNRHGVAAGQMPKVNGKMILVGGLILVLAFMWIKVFVGGSSATDEANAEVSVASTAIGKKKVIKMKRLPLPFEFGRHDRLTADLFAPRDIGIKVGKTGFYRDNQEKEQKIKSKKDAAGKLAEKLKLEAIIIGVNGLSNKAFMNGKIMVIGDKLELKLNDKKYELFVVEIFHNKVVLKWNEYTISVRMAKLDNVN